MGVNGIASLSTEKKRKWFLGCLDHLHQYLAAANIIDRWGNGALILAHWGLAVGCKHK